MYRRYKKPQLCAGKETELPLTWQADTTERVFTFASSVIERDTIRQNYTLIVDNEKLELSQPDTINIPLAPLQDMVLEAVKRNEKGEKPRLTLLFSDELDMRQSIEGLVQVLPEIPIRLKASGKQLFVNGDFSHGRSYKLKVHPGIRSSWGTHTEKIAHRTVNFADRKPQIRFARDGVFLPSSQDKRLRFATLNLRRVSVAVKKVFASNLGQFLQTEHLHSGKERRNSFSYYVQRVGVEVARDTLEISSQRNIWLEHELDLRSLITGDEQGLFLVELRFDREDMLYRSSPDGYSEDDSYYSNPNYYRYIYAHGQVYKALIISDIGLTYKRGHDQHLVYATRINNALPLPGVKVNLRTYQNQIAASGTTDAQGLVRFIDVGDEEIFYIEAEHRGQRSLIRPNKMVWNLSNFDIGGVKARPGGTRAFIYTGTRRVPSWGRNQCLGHCAPSGLYLPRRPSRYL